MDYLESGAFLNLAGIFNKNRVRTDVDTEAIKEDFCASIKTTSRSDKIAESIKRETDAALKKLGLDVDSDDDDRDDRDTIDNSDDDDHDDHDHDDHDDHDDDDDRDGGDGERDRDDRHNRVGRSIGSFTLGEHQKVSADYYRRLRKQREGSISTTREQRLREYANKNFSSRGASFDKEREVDKKAKLLNTINGHLADLSLTNVSVKDIPPVDFNSPLDEIESTAALLSGRANIQAGASLAEEYMGMAASLIEDAFDGKNIYLGRYRPDARGWKPHITAKMRRIRNDTGELVSHAVNRTTMGPMARVIMEIFGSLGSFLADKRDPTGTRNLDRDAIDAQMGSAQRDLDNL